ncbi:MAG: T9SS type A sorting domain-containing protein [Bacteroidota bacterium]
MKKFWLLCLLQLPLLSTVYCQEIDFTVRYNETESIYEVYALPHFSQASFFVGGGSQLSLVLPADVPNNRLLIETIEGGPWLDNSQIYAPEVNKGHDYHGIASNGSRIQLVEGKELLLFTFQIPEITTKKDIRLFENKLDPPSNAKGMGGGDFRNFFACVFTMKDAYRRNYYPKKETNPLVENLTPTSVKEEKNTTTDEIKLQKNSELPILAEEFVLLQNEPNPFEEKTMIRFVLPQDSEIELTFRDEAGRLLRSVKEFRKAGFNEFEYGDKDLASGLIIYQLKTDWGTQTKKMIRVH